MSKKYFVMSFMNKGCSNCLFLNSSDTGENCKILRNDIQEGEWSNINYQFKKDWRYDGCPLLHKENLKEDGRVLHIEQFMELKND